MSPVIASAAAVAVVSALSALGFVLLSLKPASHQNVIFFLVSLAVGALFGDVFFHLLPELYADPVFRPQVAWWILAGFLIFFSLEKFMRWRHCHLPDEGHAHPVVAMTLVGDSMHNFLDGLIIGASFLVDLKVGFSTTLAVIAHELPQELGHYGVLVSGGLSPRKALQMNFFSALTAFGGWAAAMYMVSLSPHFSSAVSAATAGGFVYIAGSDLVPELHHETHAGRSSLQGLAILLGLGCMALLKTFFG